MESSHLQQQEPIPPENKESINGDIVASRSKLAKFELIIATLDHMESSLAFYSIGYSTQLLSKRGSQDNIKFSYEMLRLSGIW